MIDALDICLWSTNISHNGRAGSRFVPSVSDSRLWLARDHDRVQPTFAGVTAREPRVCQADKALFRLRENNELRPSESRPHWGAMDQSLVLS
jgi:hypothetical protein